MITTSLCPCITTKTAVVKRKPNQVSRLASRQGGGGGSITYRIFQAFMGCCNVLPPRLKKERKKGRKEGRTPGRKEERKAGRQAGRKERKPGRREERKTGRKERRAREIVADTRGVKGGNKKVESDVMEHF
jgi:hypothetical protein